MKTRSTIVLIVLLLQSCGGGSEDTTNSMGQDNATIGYVLSTKFQGSNRVISVVDIAGEQAIRLANADGSNSQRWQLTSKGDGGFNFANVSVGDQYSVDVINDEFDDQIHLTDTGNFSGQTWNITPLGNGYCQLTNNFTGEGVALDILNEADKDLPYLRAAGNFTGQQWRIVNGDGSAISAEPFDQCSGVAGQVATTGDVSAPPYAGTIFVDPDIIIATDPSAFQSLSYSGRGIRTMFDRRVNDWVDLNAYLYTASYDDGLSIEIQLNPEFTAEEAKAEAERYGPMFGQLPTLLRKDVDTSWIHKGMTSWGGGNRNLLIHTGRAELYLEDGIAEETLVHEASHSSLDAGIESNQQWLDAQQADPTFISTYAQDNPNREDVAESFLPYIALRYRRDRISTEYADTIQLTIPNRIQFFDSVVQDMYPLE